MAETKATQILMLSIIIVVFALYRHPSTGPAGGCRASQFTESWSSWLWANEVGANFRAHTYTHTQTHAIANTHKERARETFYFAPQNGVFAHQHLGEDARRHETTSWRYYDGKKRVEQRIISDYNHPKSSRWKEWLRKKERKAAHLIAYAIYSHRT